MMPPNFCMNSWNHLLWCMGISLEVTWCPQYYYLHVHHDMSFFKKNYYNGWIWFGCCGVPQYPGIPGLSAWCWSIANQSSIDLGLSAFHSLCWSIIGCVVQSIVDLVTSGETFALCTVPPWMPYSAWVPLRNSCRIFAVHWGPTRLSTLTLNICNIEPLILFHSMFASLGAYQMVYSSPNFMHAILAYSRHLFQHGTDVEGILSLQWCSF